MENEIDVSAILKELYFDIGIIFDELLHKHAENISAPIASDIVLMKGDIRSIVENRLLENNQSIVKVSF